MTEDEAWDELEARLNRQKQRQHDLVRDCVLTEREACARLCEDMGAQGYGTLAIAAAIRKRSEK